MKKTLVFIIIILLAIGGYYLFKRKNTAPKDTSIKQYSNLQLGISFAYPKILTASTTDGIITLHHDIPYQNTGACDMKGDEKIYDRLTDFEMTFRVINKNLTDTVKEISPYIPQENFVNDELIASPGFIDSYDIGTFTGFAIYEGVEGCGHTTYYFPIKSGKTLVVTNASIQALSAVIVPEKVAQILAIPGTISREKNKEIFENILKSLKAN